MNFHMKRNTTLHLLILKLENVERKNIYHLTFGLI